MAVSTTVTYAAPAFGNCGLNVAGSVRPIIAASSRVVRSSLSYVSCHRGWDARYRVPVQRENGAAT